MKSNVQIMTAHDIADGFEVVARDEEGIDHPLDPRVTYLDRFGDLREGATLCLKAGDIADKVGCGRYEVIEKDGKYALLMWTERVTF